MAFQLPNPGDVQGQAQSGMNLINQIQQGDSTALMQAGITLGGSVLGKGAAVLTDVLGGAMEGFAIDGPVGAAVGAVVGFVEAAGGLISGGSDQVVKFYGLSDATQTITRAVLGMANQQTAVLSGNPQGWAMADYCAITYPPNTSTRPEKFMSLMKSAAGFVASNGFFDVVGYGQYPKSTNNGPTSVANALCSGGKAGSYGAPCNDTTGAQFLKNQVALCTPVWFDWSQQTQIGDCTADLYFGSGGAGGDVATLESRWIQSTFAQGGLTQTEIVQRALARLPDPLYWSADLYGCAISSGTFGTGFATYYYNLDLLNAMATVLMMRSMGASTQAVVSELLIQSAIINQNGAKDPGGNPLPGNPSANHAGFYSLLNDHIAMAQAENAAIAAAASAELSTAGMVGAVAAGATAAILVGILGYSAYTKTSPMTVTREAVTRIQRLRRFA
jgi:hypothetical protein